MIDNTQYVEFSEDFSTRISGGDALYKRVQYRLMTVKGEMPYDTKSLDSYLFTVGQRNNFEREVKRRLVDITTDVKVTEDDHIVVAGITVPVANFGTE